MSITKKQQQFIESDAFETLFGGAAGGGKSYGQLTDAFLFALKYAKSKQIIFRRTFADLEKSLIRVSLEMFPRTVASYNTSKHTWTFKNGSIIDFGYIDNEKDVYQYQSAEYDIIRFDELTHFTEYMYVYMISRCRGANSFPKGMKSSTNPGGIGHQWVKERFIDIGEPNITHEVIDEETGTPTTRRFIPSLVQDNKFLLENDPDYVKRLDALPEKERQALKYGDWDIFDGVFFSEFRKRIHVVEPFEIPDNWVRYASMDYGLDMLAVGWFTIDPQGNEYMYKELYESNLIISEASKRILEVNNDDNIKYLYAPPDLWNRRQDTGKSAEEIFRENKVKLTKSNNDRVKGWFSMKEHIKPYETRDEQTGETKKMAKLRFFSNCKNAIRTIPQLQTDEKNPNDVATEPHELTHLPDAIRGFCIERTRATKILSKEEQEAEELRETKYREKVRTIAGNTATRSFIMYGG